MAWDVPAGQLTIDDASGVLEDNGIESDRPRSRSAPPTAATSSRSRSRTSRRRCGSSCRRRSPRPPASTPPRSAWRRSAPRWGEEITRKAVIGARRVPGPDRHLHLVPLRVAHGADGAPGDAPRRRHQRRDLLGVRLRGHAGDRRRLPHRARLLAVRQHRRVRPHPGQRAARRRRRADGRRPRSTSRRTRCCCARSTRRWRRRCRCCRCCSIGAGLFGQVTLREFAIALLVGMLTGAYSSLFVASPLLGWLKARSPAFAGRHTGGGDHLVGDDLRAVVIAGPGGVPAISDRRRRPRDPEPARRRRPRPPRRRWRRRRPTAC